MVFFMLCFWVYVRSTASFIILTRPTRPTDPQGCTLYTRRSKQFVWAFLQVLTFARLAPPPRSTPLCRCLWFHTTRWRRVNFRMSWQVRLMIVVRLSFYFGMYNGTSRWVLIQFDWLICSLLTPSSSNTIVCRRCDCVVFHSLVLVQFVLLIVFKAIAEVCSFSLHICTAPIHDEAASMSPDSLVQRICLFLKIPF